uniref:Putative methyltransferase n=1 Tax=viral metagenome TaxID=1070528 RepID=A0A6H1ZVW4_9ZZZZ
MKYKRLEELRSELDRPSLLSLKDKKNIVGCEIGVQYGINAKNILENYDIEVFYLVDPYTEYLNTSGVANSLNEIKKVRDIARKYLKNYKNTIWIEEKSDIAIKYIPDNLDFVYIDGDHSYETTKKDIELYYPKVRSGGLVAGHDYKPQEIGVVKAVGEFFCGKTIFVGGKWDWWYIKE